MTKFNKKKNIKKNGGQAMIFSVLFFVFISMSIVFGLVSPVINAFKNARNLLNAKQALFLAKSGNEEYFYRLTKGIPISASSCVCPPKQCSCFNLDLDNQNVSIQVEDGVSSRSVLATSNVNSVIRKTRMNLESGVLSHQIVFANNYMTVGEGGVVISNNSSIDNVYSNGSVSGSGINSSSAQNVYSTGVSGLINNITLNNGYANTISNVKSGRFVYYQNLINTIALQYFPNSPNPPIITFPLTEEIIENLKLDASSGGEISGSSCVNGNYFVPVGAFGPKKINCNLVFGAGNYVLNGHVWASGNILVNENAQISTNDNTIQYVLIADNPVNRVTSSKIFLDTSKQFNGWGVPLFVSKNENAFFGGNEKAIIVTRGYSGTGGNNFMLYSPKGMISVEAGALASGNFLGAFKLNVQDSSYASFSGGSSYSGTMKMYSNSSDTWGILYWGETL